MVLESTLVRFPVKAVQHRLVHRLPTGGKRHFKPVADVESLLLQPSASARAVKVQIFHGLLSSHNHPQRSIMPCLQCPWQPNLALQPMLSHDSEVATAGSE